jgi:hypothetical protein
MCLGEWVVGVCRFHDKLTDLLSCSRSIMEAFTKLSLMLMIPRPRQNSLGVCDMPAFGIRGQLSPRYLFRFTCSYHTSFNSSFESPGAPDASLLVKRDEPDNVKLCPYQKTAVSRTMVSKAVTVPPSEDNTPSSSSSPRLKHRQPESFLLLQRPSLSMPSRQQVLSCL